MDWLMSMSPDAFNTGSKRNISEFRFCNWIWDKIQQKSFESKYIHILLVKKFFWFLVTESFPTLL